MDSKDLSIIEWIDLGHLSLKELLEIKRQKMNLTGPHLYQRTQTYTLQQHHQPLHQ
ncbi:unnamed protein product [Meloidogyne enterolobii]|uniref:Uncharacterized protein n=1 Tax=Meloidogyne enterolobii TaxID=390850 RepID=A0ACB0ZYU7_MELEN